MNRLQFGPLALLDNAVKKHQPVNNSGSTHNELLDQTKSSPSETQLSEQSDFPNEENVGMDLVGRSSAKLPRFGAEKKERSFVKPSLLAYRFFIPQGYEKNYAYPLIVYLHDRCHNEQRIDRIMPAISTRNYVGVSVAAPSSVFDRDVWGQDESTIQSARCGVLEAIEKAGRRFNIHQNRVFLVGCGSGGTMAFRIANSDPEKFAGIASINGSFPMNHRPLSKLKLARSLDIFWAHFQSSDRFTENELCSKMALLHTAGFELTVRQYPLDDQEDLCPTVFRDVNRWAMGLVSKIPN